VFFTGAPSVAAAIGKNGIEFSRVVAVASDLQSVWPFPTDPDTSHMKNKLLKNKLFLGVLLSAFATASSAALITVDWNSPPFDPAGTNVGTIHFPTNQTVVAGAGRFHGSVTALSGIDADELYESLEDFFAYCFDLQQTLAGGAEYTVVPGAPVAVRDFLGAVNAHFGGDAYRWLSPEDRTEATAIQLGIWEALYNDDFVLGTGGVHFTNVSAGVVTLFNAIAAERASTSDLSNDLVMVLQSERRQDVITGRVSTSFLVPEPGTLALAALGATVAAFARRRKR
jgi:hypothetical protein